MSSRSTDHQSFIRRILHRKLFWMLAILPLAYALLGFMVVPHLVKRLLPGAVHDRMGVDFTIGAVRMNPFLLTIELRDVRVLAPNGQQTMLTFARLLADFDLSSITRRAWVFDTVRLEDWTLQAHKTASGTWDVLKVVRGEQKPSSGSTPPPFVVTRIVSSDGAIALVDDTRAPPARLALSQLDVEASDVSSLPGSSAQYALSGKLSGGRIASQGHLQVQPLAARGSFSIDGLELSSVWELARDALPLRQPKGIAALAGTYAFSNPSGAPELRLGALDATLEQMRVVPRESPESHVALRRVAMRNASLSVSDRQLIIPKLVLSAGSATAVIGPAPSGESGAVGRRSSDQGLHDPRQPDEARAGAPWNITIESLALEHIALSYSDSRHA